MSDGTFTPQYGDTVELEVSDDLVVRNPFSKVKHATGDRVVGRVDMAVNCHDAWPWLVIVALGHEQVDRQISVS